MSSEARRTALVTGAASGMGRSTAETYLRQGWTVLAMDRDPVHPEATPATGRLVPVVADVTDRAAVDAALAATLPDVGNELHAVANVAGIYPPSTLETATEELYRRVFDVNVLGVVNVMAAAVPYMPAGSAIVNFASIDGFTVSPGQLLYGASKAAVIMLTKATALELAPKGIRVNAIAPGWIATPGTGTTDRITQAAAAIPLGRVGRPDEVAQWVWLLAGSDAASYVTGETVTVAGGFAIR
jgi:NAD(P)-dependent dehydrogenase (short-subunit alcohol dehydrogenase family)